ncbi:cation diffusion facilitator family transporter [Kistimonas asteriae]|uniref:cation diffusion facilitator family transporter n=1 Tax=Kistimonas asteriae TaxID=517724 RepID=UPI001BA63FE3|nr:cation transporter [Kistimonas asteriae]
MSVAARAEQRALKLSLAGTIFMAVMGIGFGLYLNIQAILLDGFFSLLSMGMTGLSVFTAYLIQRPEDRRFQFGYAHLEPLMNSINGIVILAVCAYSFTNGIAGLLAGGNNVSFNLALFYAIPVTVLCLVMYFYESLMAKQLDSELVHVDSKEWLVDAILTITLTLGFLLGYYLEKTPYAHLAPYLDPAMVTLLSAFAVVIPYRVLRRNLGEVLLVAPPEMAGKIRKVAYSEMKPYRVQQISTHVAKMGRRYDIEINILLDEQSPLYDATLERLDEVRHQISNRLKLDPADHWISISFTQDPDWL